MFFLLVIWGDCQPEVRGPYASDSVRLAVARKHWKRNGDRDGLYRLNLRPLAKPGLQLEVGAFGGAEMER